MAKFTVEVRYTGVVTCERLKEHAQIGFTVDADTPEQAALAALQGSVLVAFNETRFEAFNIAGIKPRVAGEPTCG